MKNKHNAARNAEAASPRQTVVSILSDALMRVVIENDKGRNRRHRYCRSAPEVANLPNHTIEPRPAIGEN